jgi:hypothetical protein
MCSIPDGYIGLGPVIHIKTVRVPIRSGDIYRVLHNIMNTVAVTCELSYSQTKAISRIFDQLAATPCAQWLLTFERST